MRNVFSQSGFTIIELLVVIGIFAILATLGLFYSMDFYRTYAASSDQNTLLSTLIKARARSVANISQHQHGVCLDLTNKKYYMFQGNGPSLVYSPTASVESVPGGEPAPGSCPAANQIVFDQISGNTACSPECTFTLNSFSQTKTIKINSQGAILW